MGKRGRRPKKVQLERSAPTSRNNQLRLGIIGAGMYACAAHMPALRQLQNVKVVAVCRLHKDRLKQFCKMFNIPKGYTDYKQMLAKEELDGVIVASPNALHYEHTMAALNKGLPVLVEKPMTVKVSQAREIVNFANKSSIPVVVGYNRHYWANFCYAKKMIEEGDIGNLTYVTARWVADIEWALARIEPPGYFRAKAFYKEGDPPNFRGDLKMAGGGMFIDGGSHMADAMLWTTGLRPQRLYATLENRGFPVDCDATVSISFDNGALASCSVLGATKTFKAHELHICGTKGSIYIDDYTIVYQLNGQKEVQVVDLPGDSSPTANFVHVLQEKDRVHCSALDGLRTAIMVEAVYQSGQKGSPVEIKNWV